MTQAFILRLAERLQSSLSSNTVSVGWANALGLDQVHDWDEFKSILRDAYPHLYQGNERGLGSAAGSLWRFIHDIKIGDIIAIPTERAFYVARVDSGIIYDTTFLNDDSAWRRAVTWLTAPPIPRDYAHNNLQLRLKSRQTCVDASDLLTEIETARNSSAPVNIVSEIRDTVRDAVAKALLNAVNDRGLEKIVYQLVMADGASVAEIPAKNSGKPGDADVIATYDCAVGGAYGVQLKIAYQVKQHRGVSDEWGIQQLIDRIKNTPDNDIRYGCLVTTAENISPAAEELCKTHPEIFVIKLKELVDWVLNTGLSAISEHAA